ncbi:MAG TPA: phage major capsid protein [Acidimicrobiales bacterium]|nr:phage major capsid protein [Acidimicrobiales bacterium]
MPTPRERLTEVLERRQRAWSAAEKIITEAAERGEDMTAEETASWQRARDEVMELTTQAETLRDHLGLSDTFTRVRRDDIPVGDEPARNDGGRRVVDSDEYRSAFDRYMRGGEQSLATAQRELLEQARANLPQSSGDDTLGGYLVPTEFANRIIETARSYNSLVEAGAEVQVTGTGVEIQFPTSNEAEEGEIIAENQAVIGQEIVFGMRAIAAHIFSSKMVKIPRSLLSDSRVDLEDRVRGILGRRIGRRQARGYAVGSGVGEPQGIVTAAQVVRTTVAANAITYTDLVRMRYGAVDEAYDDRSSWLFNRTVLEAVMLLLDGNGRPLFSPSPNPSQPDTILGRPFRTNGYMPAMAANTKPILFGDVGGYLIREVDGVLLQRLVERYAEFHQIAFIAFHRADGALLDLGAVKALQMAAV